MGAESSANCVAQTASSRTQETYMYDITNLEKLSAFSKAVPEAMASFQAFDKAALADGAIPKKYKELMAVAVGLTTRCHRTRVGGDHLRRRCIARRGCGGPRLSLGRLSLKAGVDFT